MLTVPRADVDCFPARMLTVPRAVVDCPPLRVVVDGIRRHSTLFEFPRTKTGTDHRARETVAPAGTVSNAEIRLITLAGSLHWPKGREIMAIKRSHDTLEV